MEGTTKLYLHVDPGWLPWMCLTLCGWGLWREKNEWWLSAPKRALPEISLLPGSGVNCSGLLLPPPLSPVVTWDAVDRSWNDIWNRRSKHRYRLLLGRQSHDWDIDIHTFWRKLESAIREHNFTSQHVIFEYNNSKSSSLTLYLRKEPLAANCTDVCCLCCQETWTKQETMPMMAAQHFRQPLPERSSCFKTISSDRHKENCRSVCEGDCFCLFVCLPV